jgi:hypothetical protein
MSEDAITNLQRRVTSLEHHQRPRLESGDPYRVTWLEQRIGILEQRLVELEAFRDQQAAQTALKPQAAQQAATGEGKLGQAPCSLDDYAERRSRGLDGFQSGLYAPLRSDTKPLIALAAFARRLLNPDDLAHAVTHEVRNAARRALGIPEVREYDL